MSEVPSDLPSRVRREFGVWQYPFAKVKLRQGEGWWIDMLEAPEGIPIEQVEAGDRVADFALNMTPYWTVASVDLDEQRVWLEPSETNPFLTGRGAGGKEITDYDWRVATGEEHQRRMDDALERVSKAGAVEYSDVKALLLGIVPVQFGPNGAQGGWYSSGDTWSNVGGRKGLSAEEIQRKDAAAVARLGFDVPPAALRGEVKPDAWDAFVQDARATGSSSHELRRMLQTLLEGEDWDDPEAMERFVRGHPMPSIKARNLSALLEWWNPFPREEIDRSEEGVDWEDAAQREAAGRRREAILASWRSGERADPALGRRIRRLLADVASMRHRAEAGSGFDPYWGLREMAIKQAQLIPWPDVVRAFEGATDHDNRRYVAYAWGELGDLAALRRMEAREEHPSALQAILRSIEDAGGDPLELVDAQPGRYAALTAQSGDAVKDYHAKELEGEIRSLRRKSEGRWP